MLVYWSPLKSCHGVPCLMAVLVTLLSRLLPPCLATRQFRAKPSVSESSHRKVSGGWVMLKTQCLATRQFRARNWLSVGSQRSDVSREFTCEWGGGGVMLKTQCQRVHIGKWVGGGWCWKLSVRESRYKRLSSSAGSSLAGRQPEIWCQPPWMVFYKSAGTWSWNSDCLQRPAQWLCLQRPV